MATIGEGGHVVSHEDRDVSQTDFLGCWERDMSQPGSSSTPYGSDRTGR